MNFKSARALWSIGICAILLVSCESGNETNISSNGLNRSHNMGRNCMDCHKSGGEGEGWFTAAGTAYKLDLVTTSPNGNVKLYTQPKGAGTLRATIQVDAKGNFYTTETIDFSGGVYPVYTNSSGSVKYMTESTDHGKCNSCHGVSEDRIYAP